LTSDELQIEQLTQSYNELQSGQIPSAALTEELTRL